MVKRCDWAKGELMVEYHDKEWGIPVHDDRKLFEMLTLEGVQAGLSWMTVLKKRESYRKAFNNFDPVKISKYSAKDIKRLLKDEGIIRNKMKILATINNAKKFLEVQKEFESFDNYLWNFVNYKTINNEYNTVSELPSHTIISDKLSKDLKKRGFKFVGSIICYAFMQAVGMVNDHTRECYKKTDNL